MPPPEIFACSLSVSYPPLLRCLRRPLPIRVGHPSPLLWQSRSPLHLPHDPFATLSCSTEADAIPDSSHFCRTAAGQDPAGGSRSRRRRRQDGHCHRWQIGSEGLQGGREGCRCGRQGGVRIWREGCRVWVASGRRSLERFAWTSALSRAPRLVGTDILQPSAENGVQNAGN